MSSTPDPPPGRGLFAPGCALFFVSGMGARGADRGGPRRGEARDAPLEGHSLSPRVLLACLCGFGSFAAEVWGIPGQE